MSRVRFIGSFRFKLIIVLISLILVPLIVFSALLFSWVKDIISKKYSESAIQSVRESTINIDYRLRDLEEFTNIILTNTNFIELLEKKDAGKDEAIAYENLLRGFFTSREDIEGISVYAGPAFYSIGTNKGVRTDTSTDWFKNLAGTHGEIQWIPTRLEKIKIMAGYFNKHYFSIGRKVVDFNTLEELGTMVIDLDEGILEKSYSSLVNTGEVEAFICDSRGRVISHPDKTLIGQDFSYRLPVAKVLEAGKEYGEFSYKDDQKENMVLYSTCSTNGWKLVKIVPGNYLYSEIESIKSFVLNVGTVYLILTLCVALFFSWKLTNPIIDMMRKMKEAESGKLDTRIEIRRKDELGQLGISFNNMLFKIRSLIDQLLEEERSKKEIELEVLHAQINPHFLYNTLNTIKWMAKMQGAKNISSTVTALIKLLRVSINLSNEMVTLQEEIEYVKNYVLIQQIRFNEQFTIRYSIAEECQECRIPKLILQPIVENSIIYGSREEEEHRLNIDITAERSADTLVIRIEDNGPGIEEDVLKKVFKAAKEKNVNKFSVVGLNNVMERIKLYFGDNYGMEISTEVGKGTRVTIQLPFASEGRGE